MCSVHPILLACLGVAVLCAPVSSAGSGRAGVLTPSDVLRTSVRSASLASIEEAALPHVPELRPAPRMRLGADRGIPAHIRPRDGDDAFRGETTFTFAVRRRGATATSNDSGRDTLGRRGGVPVRPVGTMTRSSTDGGRAAPGGGKAAPHLDPEFTLQEAPRSRAEAIR